MPPYATQADFEAYVEGWETTDPAALERLLERATRDVDALLAPIRTIRTGTWAGLRVDPARLEPWARDALVRAVCAQAEFRFHAGETQRVGAGNTGAKRIKGPDFEIDYGERGAGAARIGAKVADELRPLRGTLIATSARARA